MKLTSLINYDLVQFNFSATDKKEALDKLTTMLVEKNVIASKDSFLQALLEREAQSTTGVGEAIAIPHAKSDDFKEATVIYAKSDAGVEWESFDGLAAKHIFMICAPSGGADEHLKALSTLSMALMDSDVKAGLEKATKAEDVKEVFEKFVAKNEAPKAEEATKTSDEKPYVVAVTACPTGIAHTFMAAEKLKETAKELGVDIKVETNGQIGVENKLTKEDIDRAVGVIVAADKKVEVARFNGKPAIITKVSDGINKPKELLQNIIDGKTPKYVHNGDVSTDEDTANESLGRRAYKHLMEGVSNMLPFVVAGGMLIALSFIWGITSYDPKADDYNAFAAVIFWFGQIAFSMMLPILAGFIGRSIADRPGFIIGVFGGILANPSILGLAAGNELLTYTPSGFLGALVAGFLAGGIVQVLKYLFSWLPRSLDGLKPIFIFPILGTSLMGTLMIYVINAPMASVMEGLKGFIEGLNGSGKLLVGFVVGAMMAIDMGGPINKAAYVTGTGLLASAGTLGSDVMAAVMVGGMVPPLAIALSATVSKNIWPASQREGALVNYVMGLAFITEGAIPFAASNPLRVIPPLFVGAGVAGALSMIFGIVSKAPHGGIFAVVAGGVTNPVMYLLAMLIGAVIGAVLLIVSLKTVKK
ncbi:fructose-specific PTS transporter subunit EIIC [Gemella sp. zg-1178]|uniref:PTS fructose transporter subunit IIABC n=1 Tax=Gemella sp. zg-1178 TaxID=2840372 RepID=UPI001C040954|nr:fructose-specific PTS transporter subunit EIIC [Gemella sp. zg-1178]MBU0279061.1 fructose-specific PTS transporter subunit EIIC [Gemella sp. zg-1178]